MELITPKLKRSENGREYCENTKEVMAAAAYQFGLSKMAIAEITNMDISTVRKWFREGNGAFKAVKLLADHLNGLVKQPGQASAPQENQAPAPDPDAYGRWLEDGKRSGFLNRWIEDAKRLGLLPA